MKTYSDIKRELMTASREVRNNEISIVNTLKEIEYLEREIIEAEQLTNSEASSKEELALRSHIEQVLAPIKELKELEEQKLIQLDQALEDRLEDQIIKKQKEKTDLIIKYNLEGIEAVLLELNSKLQRLLGVRFAKVLVDSIEDDAGALDEDRFSVLLKECLACSKSLDSLSNDSRGIVDFMFNILEKVTSVGNNDDDKSSKWAFAIISLLLMIVAYKFVFPFYIVAIVGIGWYNIKNTSKLKESLIIQKSVETNLPKIKQFINDKLDDKYNKLEKSLRDKIQGEKEKSNQELDRLSKEISLVHSNVASTFQYDSSNDLFYVESFKNVKLNAIKERKSNISRLEKFSEELKQKEESIKEELTSVIGNIESEYLDRDKIGKLTSFDTNFLIDIVDNKPIFMSLLSESSIFLYDRQNISGVFKLLRLLIQQIRCRLDPNVYTLSVLDPIFSGDSFFDFIPKNVETSEKAVVERSFKVYTNIDGFNENIESIVSTFLRKQKNIKSECDTIEQYNKVMLELDSITEGYDFYFLVNGLDVLLNSQLTPCVVNGSNYGTKICVFIENTDFIEKKAEILKIIDNVGAIYSIEEEEITKKARQCVRDQLSEA